MQANQTEAPAAKKGGNGKTPAGKSFPNGRFIYQASPARSTLECGQRCEGIGLFRLDLFVACVLIGHFAVVVQRHGRQRQNGLLLNPVCHGQTAGSRR